MTTTKPEPYAEEAAWHPAHLIPTSGIGGVEEQEKRATSALLAVIKGVPEFGRALLAEAGAPAGRISTYAEVQLKATDGSLSIPDGAIVVARGSTHWRCLVEVKTGDMGLRADQIDRYLDIARLHGFQAVVTVSNQLTAGATESPVSVDGRKLKRVALRHLSWWHILTEARVQAKNRAISDPDQAWILDELIAYLANPKSGASGFTDMGDHWVAVREGARQGALKANDKGVRDVSARWDQLVQHLALALSQDLGRDVEPVAPRGQDAVARIDAAVRRLVDEGRLTAALRVPDAAAPLEIEADLRSRLLTTAVEVPAPREGRIRTRIGWIIRQLDEVPDGYRLSVRYPNVKEPVSATLKDARALPDRLLWGGDLKREPRSFRIHQTAELGLKRGLGQGTFIDATERQVDLFYGSVVQRLRLWRPSPPRLSSSNVGSAAEPGSVVVARPDPGAESLDQDRDEVRSEGPAEPA